MAYLKIDGTDFSAYVNKLKIKTSNNYNSQTNAAGDTVVDYINKKRVIEVGIIPLNDTNMKTLKTAINKFNVNISYLDPDTKALSSDVSCIIPANEIEYYTIQAGNVSFEAVNLSFEEL